MKADRARELKLCVGAVSQHVIDALITVNARDVRLPRVCLIPSYNQVKSCGGYTRIKTQELSRLSELSIVLERDHAGLKKGWSDELAVDADVFDIIHIDPWAQCPDVDSAALATASLIRYCDRLVTFDHRDPLLYEVGTEEGIRPYTADEFDRFMSQLRKHLNFLEYDRIVFAVVQTGTRIKDLKNSAEACFDGTIEMVRVCKRYEKLAKEHSSDYMNDLCFRARVQGGVDCFNIAPELGTIVSRQIAGQLVEHGLEEELRQLQLYVHNRNDWARWLSCAPQRASLAFEAAGHYHVNSDEVVRVLEKVQDVDLDRICQRAVEERIQELLWVIDDR